MENTKKLILLPINFGDINPDSVMNMVGDKTETVPVVENFDMKKVIGEATISRKKNGLSADIKFSVDANPLFPMINTVPNSWECAPIGYVIKRDKETQAVVEFNLTGVSIIHKKK